MHECPYCGQVCACDGEDTWLEQPEDCVHFCLDEDFIDEDDLINEEEYWQEEAINKDEK